MEIANFDVGYIALWQSTYLLNRGNNLISYKKQTFSPIDTKIDTQSFRFRRNSEGLECNYTDETRNTDLPSIIASMLILCCIEGWQELY
jgi:hypothetical protein